MAGALVPVSTFTAGTALTGAEIVPVVQGGATRRTTAAAIAALAGVPPSTPTTPSDWKDEVDVATTANITLSGEQTLDGFLTSASRVLVKNQTNAAQNGPYVSAAGAWSRSTDADTSAEVTSGMGTIVLNGTVNGGVLFYLVTPDPITLGTTLLTYQGMASAFPAFIGKTVAGTTYTTVLLDSGKRLNCTNAAAKTITVAPQNTVNSAVNTEIEVFNAGAGLLTLAPDSGVTLNSAGSVLVIPQNVCVKVKKRANPNTWDVTGWFGTNAIQTVTSSATVTPTFDNDAVKITAQAAALALANPTGTAKDMHGLAIHIKDNGTARAISYDTQYRAIGVTLPTTTVLSKTLYLGCIWNTTDTKLDVVAVAQEA